MLSLCCNSHLDHVEIKKDPQRIAKIKPLLNEYNWEGIHFP